MVSESLSRSNSSCRWVLASIIIISLLCGKNAEIWNNTNTDYANQLHKSRFNAWQFSVGYYF
jgi:hypothetical protein